MSHKPNQPKKIILLLQNGSRITFTRQAGERLARASKPVELVGVDRPRLRQFDPRLAKRLRCPRYFVSLRKLADFIGSTAGTLRLALCKARKNQKSYATVRGVTFHYFG